MAIVENPKIGRARNKLGNTVFYTNKWGVNILREKPIHVHNPRTPVQQANRMRLKKLIFLVHQALNYINVAYAGSVQGMSACNRFVSINMKKCFIGDTNSIDPSLFVLCDNDGSFVDNVVLTSTVSNTINGTFDSNAQNPDEDTDPVKAYGFYADGYKFWQFDQVSIRSNGIITLTHPDMSGLNIAVYFECLDRVNLLMDKPKHVIKYVGTVTVI
jgi:hypothetical protein